MVASLKEGDECVLGDMRSRWENRSSLGLERERLTLHRGTRSVEPDLQAPQPLKTSLRCDEECVRPRMLAFLRYDAVKSVVRVHTK